ncbi:hypothetical protein EJ08DRAFT_648346 [Tothia fuscella]|uniref:Multiple myeloma tumor-associated protein 2-like N-terminal domain-containing protein n=1 Tax=Tothia fuscella TaxID=1048955 RepID=A0A9P4TZA5_9PEZI|nr:hypothetical protein EJ08DRAFT_648346 [Tothia fuscella]
MDLLSTVRKEGSRGGRSEFKWEDVKNDSQRENYLGHSLMAPVGRWQKGRDLGWYAKGDQSADAMTEAEKRKEEIRKIKEAEEDARLVALGLPPKDRNANLMPLGEGNRMGEVEEKVELEVEEKDGLGKDSDRKKRRHRSRDREDRKHRHRRHRSESRNGDRHRRHRSQSRDGDRHRKRRSRSRSRNHDARRRDHFFSPVRRREDDDRRKTYGGRDRARSPKTEEKSRKGYSDKAPRSPGGRRRDRSRSRSPYYDRRRD